MRNLLVTLRPGSSRPSGSFLRTSEYIDRTLKETFGDAVPVVPNFEARNRERREDQAVALAGDGEAADEVEDVRESKKRLPRAAAGL